MFEPWLKANHSGVDLAAVGTAGWIGLGFSVAFPTAWLWRRITGVHGQQTAEEYIRTLKQAMTEAGLPKTDQKVVWRAMFAKLAEESPPTGRLPSPAEMLREALPPGAGAA